MKTLNEILGHHLKSCFANNGIRISEEYERRIKRAMKEYAIQKLKQVTFEAAIIGERLHTANNIEEIIKEIENEQIMKNYTKTNWAISMVKRTAMLRFKGINYVITTWV